MPETADIKVKILSINFKTRWKQIYSLFYITLQYVEEEKEE